MVTPCPPALVMVPVIVAVLWVVTPLVAVSVGKPVGVGAVFTLAGCPAPIMFTALTATLWEPPERLVKTCDVTSPTFIHGPWLRDTSYLVIDNPPLHVGCHQLKVT